MGPGSCVQDESKNTHEIQRRGEEQVHSHPILRAMFDVCHALCNTRDVTIYDTRYALFTVRRDDVRYTVVYVLNPIPICWTLINTHI